MHCAANYIRDDISTRLNDIFLKYPDYSLVICGYSLGAGIGAILSVILKSRYPDLKCYGIAMPGSVLSEGLANATRHFIYSYVVDVDMIPRGSIRSLEDLRDRIVDALNKCNRCKLNILTRTFARTLIKRRQVFHTNIDQQNLNSTVSQLVIRNNRRIERERLVLPGTIIHLFSTDRIGLFTRKTSYRSRLCTYEQFSQLIIHPRMWFDHFPASYSTALTSVISVSKSC